MMDPGFSNTTFFEGAEKSVHPAGVEPAWNRLEDGCLVHLGDGCKGRPRGVASWSFRVDADLFWPACQYRCGRVSPHGHMGFRLPKGGANILLHQWVMASRFGMAPLPPLTVDHIDGDPSNNTLANLRPATRRLQGLNRRGFVGASVDRGKWKARCCDKVLGCFSTREEAEAAYRLARQEAIESEVAVSWLAYMAQLKEVAHGV